MGNLFNWVEIPVADMARAKAFYEALLATELPTFPLGGLTYALFPAVDFGGHGALVMGEGHRPSASGPLVYLDAEGRLDALAARLKILGAKVVLERTVLSRESGELLHFIDSEGNRIGLHSPVRPLASEPVPDSVMHGLLSQQQPGFAFILTRGPRYDDPALAGLQWEHARNMFTLMRDGRLAHVSVLTNGAPILGFGLMVAETREEVEAVLAADPGVAGGRLAFEVMSAVSFDGERTRRKL